MLHLQDFSWDLPFCFRRCHLSSALWNADLQTMRPCRSPLFGTLRNFTFLRVETEVLFKVALSAVQFSKTPPTLMFPRWSCLISWLLKRIFLREGKVLPAELSSSSPETLNWRSCARLLEGRLMALTAWCSWDAAIWLVWKHRDEGGQRVVFKSTRSTWAYCCSYIEYLSVSS